jgi:hydroxymethylpyrimidine/phosphomethylpyrimidine kinase
MREAAALIRQMGARAVLIKGGHLKNRRQEHEAGPGNHSSRGESIYADETVASDEAIDVLDNDGVVTVFREERVPNAEFHGTGCMLSAAIAAGLGKGKTLEESVRAAKQFVFNAIRECT